MVQLVVRVVLEADGGRGHPLCVLLRDALLRHARQLELLPAPQLRDERPVAVRVHDDGVSQLQAPAVTINDEVSRVDLHDVVRGAPRVEAEPHAARVAELLAVAVARVVERVDVLGDKGDEAQAVREELVGQDRRVDLHLDEVDGQRRDLGLDDATDRVGEGEVGARELEVDLEVVCLSRGRLAWGRGWEVGAAYGGDLDRRPALLAV